VPVHMR